MELLLIRHGDAVDEAPGLGDDGRGLTGRGRETTRAVAAWLRAHKSHRPAEIWTSPLVRAVQTAEILAEAMELGDEVTVHAELSTRGRPQDALDRALRHHGHGPLALVGHEPSLSMMAVALLGREIHWPGFKKSGVLAVHRSSHGHASFRFYFDPKHLRAITDPSALR